METGQLGFVQQFVDIAKRTFTLPILKQHMMDAVKEIGFAHFSMTHHVDLQATGAANNVALTNYPDDFVENYLTTRMYRSDPVVAASCHTATGFKWSEMGRLIRFRKDQLRIFELSRRTGLGEGYAVPVHLPGEANGACVFATQAGHDIPAQNEFMAQLIGRYAFDAARMIIRRRDHLPKPGGEPKLTTRQIDCVLLVAKGHSNHEIAEKLSIRTTTVTDYLDEARRRYNARNRTQLAMRAVFDGTFSLSDALS